MKIRLIDFNGPAPVRAHDNDAGPTYSVPGTKRFTLGKCSSSRSVWSGAARRPRGLHISAQRLSAKGIVCELPPIDSGYRGEVHAIVSNVGNDGYDIKKGDRIGQLVIMPVVVPEFTYDESAARGTGAFGSSGR